MHKWSMLYRHLQCSCSFTRRLAASSSQWDSLKATTYWPTLRTFFIPVDDKCYDTVIISTPNSAGNTTGIEALHNQALIILCIYENWRVKRMQKAPVLHLPFSGNIVSIYVVTKTSRKRGDVSNPHSHFHYQYISYQTQMAKQTRTQNSNVIPWPPFWTNRLKHIYNHRSPSLSSFPLMTTLIESHQLGYWRHHSTLNKKPSNNQGRMKT